MSWTVESLLTEHVTKPTRKALLDGKLTCKCCGEERLVTLFPVQRKKGVAVRLLSNCKFCYTAYQRRRYHEKKSLKFKACK